MYRDSGVGKGVYDVEEEIMVRVNEEGKDRKKLMSLARDIPRIVVLGFSQY